MTAYIARRLLLAFVTIWAISILSFIIIELPEGDSVDKWMDWAMQQGDTSHNPELAQYYREYLGLDQPQYIRYLKWVGNLMRGELGYSFGDGYYASGEKPIKSIIGDRIWITIVLTSFTIIVTWTFAIPVGIYAAVRQHSVGDYVFTVLGFTGLAVPDFLLGLVLMYVGFAYFNQNVGGLFSADYVNAPWSFAKAYDLFQHLWIPAVVLGTSEDGWADQGDAEQSAGRAQQTLRNYGPRQGRQGLQAHPEVPRAGGDQPAGEHGRVPAAISGGRQRYRLSGPEPADGRPHTAARHTPAGPLPGGLPRAAPGRPDGHRHPHLRHPAGRGRPPDQVHGAVGTQGTEFQGTKAGKPHVRPDRAISRVRGQIVGSSRPR